MFCCGGTSELNCGAGVRPVNSDLWSVCVEHGPVTSDLRCLQRHVQGLSVALSLTCPFYNKPCFCTEHTLIIVVQKLCRYRGYPGPPLLPWLPLSSQSESPSETVSVQTQSVGKRLSRSERGVPLPPSLTFDLIYTKTHRVTSLTNLILKLFSKNTQFCLSLRESDVCTRQICVCTKITSRQSSENICLGPQPHTRRSH